MWLELTVTMMKKMVLMPANNEMKNHLFLYMSAIRQNDRVQTRPKAYGGMVWSTHKLSVEVAPPGCRIGRLTLTNKPRPSEAVDQCRNEVLHCLSAGC